MYESLVGRVVRLQHELTLDFVVTGTQEELIVSLPEGAEGRVMKVIMKPKPIAYVHFGTVDKLEVCCWVDRANIRLSKTKTTLTNWPG